MLRAPVMFVIVLATVGLVLGGVHDYLRQRLVHAPELGAPWTSWVAVLFVIWW